MRRGAGSFYDRVVKRAFDIAASSTALLALSPVLVGVAIAVRMRHGSPVFFRQRRAGFRGVIFEIIKFRTMTDERDARGSLLPDKLRTTRLGKWLRETSLDELPELFNVLSGDMSLVGPRPLLVHYLEHYDERQAKRHDCRPGLTGWAAVNGRNNSPWSVRFENDVYYVEHLGPWLDLVVLLKTIALVLGRADVDPSFADQMPEFRRDKRSQ
jgi:lipopolysaccharide/colanic/teichoic acid biosynthesis glycosyltransferase